jgi:hypothetical protein
MKIIHNYEIANLHRKQITDILIATLDYLKLEVVSQYRGAATGVEFKVMQKVNNEANAQQPIISAEEARKLVQACEKVQYYASKYFLGKGKWVTVAYDGEKLPTVFNDGEVIKYRAIQPQAQPEPVIVALDKINTRIDKKLESFHKDESFSTELKELAEKAIAKLECKPVDRHAALRAVYTKQVADKTERFYKWEVNLNKPGVPAVWIEEVPSFASYEEYRCTDISCYVSKDGEPAIRMLLSAVEELKFELGNDVDWFITIGHRYRVLSLAEGYVMEN